MKLWLDAQLPPALAAWIAQTFGIDTLPIRDLGMLEATDLQIFESARDASAVVVTKDSDFVELSERLGSPPQVLWVTCGNTTNARLMEILVNCLPQAIQLLKQGEPIVEINDAS
jgi:predicted nuclease of predicted toxin-antitoxin system